MKKSAPAVTASPSPRHRIWELRRKELLSIETTRMEPLIALRNAIGVVVPLALGIALGNPTAGVAACSGALQVSYSDSPGPYRQRARLMLTACVLCSLAVVAGGLVRTPLTAAALIVGWGFLAGLVTCLGDTAENLGVISLVTLIIYAVQPLTWRQAIIGGLLALSGGLLQTTLALGSWPIRRYAPEQRKLSALYFELSIAIITPAYSESPSASQAFTAARQTLADLAGDMSLQAERYWSLLNQAERIGLTFLALRRLRKRLEREARAQTALQAVEQFLAGSAMVLVDVGRAIRTRRASFRSEPQLLAQLETLADHVRQEQARASGPFLAALENDARFQMDALTGQLRAAVRTAAEATPAQIEEFAIRDATRPWQARFLGGLAKLRANLTLKSSAFRHAIRLTLSLLLGEAIAHLLHHPRSYWLAMTIVIVLKKEFAATFSRGVHRIMGTILGLIFATALFHLLPHGIGLEVVLVGGLVFVLRWAGAGNYGVFTIAMSALVVILLAITGVPPAKVVFPRAEMTFLGGLTALTTYLVWPTWERNQAAETLARLVEAYRVYFDALARAHLNGKGAKESELGHLRMAARLARSNMLACHQRLRVEPGSNPNEVALLAALLANSHHFVRAIMAIEAVSREAAPARPEFRVFASDVNTTLDALVRTLRYERRGLGPLPDLREDHRRLVNSVDSDLSRYGLISEETDRMTNSLNTLAEQIESWVKLRRNYRQVRA